MGLIPVHVLIDILMIIQLIVSVNNAIILVKHVRILLSLAYLVQILQNIIVINHMTVNAYVLILILMILLIILSAKNVIIHVKHAKLNGIFALIAIIVQKLIDNFQIIHVFVWMVISMITQKL